MEIIPDPVHVALLVLPFLVAAGALHVILWKPLLGYLEERHEVSRAARHEAEELDGAAAEQMTRIEARLAEARDRVSGTRSQARARARAAEAQIVAAARHAADQRVSDALDKVRTEKWAASGTLAATAADLSADIAGRVLVTR